MAFRNRVYGAGKLLVIAAALLVTYVGFAVGSMRYALRAREVQVPDLTNHTSGEASMLISELGLSLKVDDTTRIDPKIAAGRVLTQDPAPGSTTRRQRTVRVGLSAGARVTTVPGVTGETQRIAEARLQQGGIAVAAISEIRSQDYATDLVVAQQPPARAAAGSVSLLVNRSDRSAAYVMPDLIGVSGDRAADALRKHGFRAAALAGGCCAT